MVVEASAPGLAPARLELKTVPFAGEPVRHLPPLPPTGADEPVWVRKVELSAGERQLTPERPSVEISARLLPESAAACLRQRSARHGGLSAHVCRAGALRRAAAGAVS